MNVSFSKYQGTGNDFIMIDNREGGFPVSQPLIEKLCDRRFGIGGDGLILLQNEPGYDFRMVYFNSDGREGSMCGNGGRCTVQFAADLGVFEGHASFFAVDGVHEANEQQGVVNLKMSDVGEVEHYHGYDFLNTGSPHVVIYVDNVAETDVVGIGRNIRYGEVYGPQGGTNVNFVEVVEENFLKVRTYERGVEDETFSCGTGVTACVLSAHLKYGWNEPVRVEVQGGELEVSFEAGGKGSFTDIYLKGPAVKVFEGGISC